MKIYLLERLNQYLKNQNEHFQKNLEDISLISYSRLKYDEFSELVQYCRFLIEIDYPKCNYDYLNRKLIEFQNIFVQHLMKAISIEQVDSYYAIGNQFILSLFGESIIEE